MVFQSYALYPHMNVADNMSYSLKLRNTAKELIAEVGARRGGKARPRSAAGAATEGTLRRPAPARRHGPRHRSPTARPSCSTSRLSNLDARLREQMRAEIKKLHADLGATSIYVTHDQIEAMTLADRIVAMHGGVVQQVGSPLELYDRPANLFVAGFIGSPGMNFLSGTYQEMPEGAAVVLEDGVSIPITRHNLKSSDTVTLGIRPEHVTISEDGQWAADIYLVEPTGFGTILHMVVHGQRFKVFTLDRAAVTSRTGMRVDFPDKYMHLFDHSGARVD